MISIHIFVCLFVFFLKKYNGEHIKFQLPYQLNGEINWFYFNDDSSLLPSNIMMYCSQKHINPFDCSKFYDQSLHIITDGRISVIRKIYEEHSMLDSVNITIPLYKPDGEISITFSFFGNNLESLKYQVQEFCLHNYLLLSSCSIINDYAIELFSQHKINLDRFNENRINYSTMNAMFKDFPNPHLQRVRYAQEIEEQNIKMLTNNMLLKPRESLSQDIEVAWNILNEWILLQRTSLSSQGRISIIHSASLPPDPNWSVLSHILSFIQQNSTLLASPRWIGLVVVNHGIPIPLSFRSLFPHVSLWIEYSPSTSQFEIPTLQLMHRLSHLLAAWSPDSQILYLHTKGVSYLPLPASIQDWTDMNLYFLVHKHEACEHLLLSGHFDVLGTNFLYIHFPHFRGNLYWVRSSYLSAHLPSPPHTSTKYFSEYWILSAPPPPIGAGEARVFNLHSSGVDHSTTRYEPHQYQASDKRLPSFQPLLYLREYDGDFN